MNKKSKIGHVEYCDRLVPETSKPNQNKIYCTRSKRKSAWESQGCKNILEEMKSVKSTQDCQSSTSSKKRKSFESLGSIPAECSSKTESTDDIKLGNKLKACYSSKRNKSSTSDTVVKHAKQTDLHTTKNAYNIKLVDKIKSKRMVETTQLKKEKDELGASHVEAVKTSSDSKIERQLKVSAQSRLITKRKEFETTAKKALNSMTMVNSNLLMQKEKEKTIKGAHYSERKYAGCIRGSSESSWVPIMTRVRDRVNGFLREYTEKNTNINNNKYNNENLIFVDEEMDWEPSEQEVMIEHIKKMRRNCGDVEELSNDIVLCSNSVMETTQDESNLIMVFDTNVFISCLPFIKEIRDTHIPVLGLPRIFIPWRVLQELDRLKTSDIKPLQVSAVRAIRFLNENFTSRHPGLTGQSFEDHASTVESSRSHPDDEILHVCLSLKQKDKSKIVILITNDKNLESKAIVSGIETYSKDRFIKEKLIESSRKAASVNTGSKTKTITLKSDMAYCRLKSALKKFLQQLLETEFMNAFSKDWKKVVTKKPPWMLMDMFECLIKHWRSVFHFIFKRDVLVLIEDLKDHFVKVDKGEITVVNDIAQVTKELLMRMTVYITDEKPYSKTMTETLSEVESWMESKKPTDPEKHEENQSLSPTPVPTSSQEPPIQCNSHFDPALCKENVKNLFQMIWEHVKAFFLRVSELAAGNGMNNPDAVNEVKIQFPHVIRKIQELVEIVEKLLSLGPEEASQAQAIILHFTNFLVSLNVFQIDATELNNLPGYIGLFCADNGGRLILCTLVNDLKQFVMGMMDGMKVLEQL